ncbi:MAG: amylo-alpha-1,6-glucosidase [Nitrospirae bacterium]|nr:MAG: amylo-alpha-1,6-glucosidase [Nitrospirota bacterium]
MQKVIKLGDEHYILATSALADDRTRVLKHGETFAVFNRYGDIQPIGLKEQGLYHEGTRFLSRMELMLETTHPFLLSSAIRQDNTLLAVDLTNPDVSLNDHTFIPRGTVYLSRAKLLWQSCCYERFRLINFGLDTLDITFSLHVDSDFADIFEVRGERRAKRGDRFYSVDESGCLVISYTGLDGIRRQTRITPNPAPVATTETSITFAARLAPKEEHTFYLTIACQVGERAPSIVSFQEARASAAQALEIQKSQFCRLYTENEQFNDWTNRSLDDIAMMITDLPEGPYPYAGVPWFNTPFGRDGIITALECLWINPNVARGVLAFLAATQADDVIPEQDAEPGKILHETRCGEMAALKEIPFARYYGSVDATPLFVMLAGAYYERTGDRAFVSSIWPNIERALQWIERYGDQDGDGFIEYVRHSSHGLLHQGWKDSHDSVFHADGSFAKGPIALCEVQAYVYAAKKAAATLARVLGQNERAEELGRQAEQLRTKFDRAFWSDELGTYVLALDGEKRPCRVRASNAGHCLFAGIAMPERVSLVAKTLFGEQGFSGWGIRTLHANEVRYNPMSYHNGSVWPHDNALIAYGLSRYGYMSQVHEIMTGLFDMSIYVELHRLPELVCGFPRRPEEGPTLYPVACAPQAWASGAVFLLLQACLGLSFDGANREIRLTRPSLPPYLPSLQINNLRIGEASADLVIARSDEDVTVNVVRKDESLNIVTVK